MITGLLINAGLWTPMDDQIWNFKINWQPIPYGKKRAKNITMKKFFFT